MNSMREIIDVRDFESLMVEIDQIYDRSNCEIETL